MSDNEYRGSCFCGAVQVRVNGEPAAMGYCHCGDCRSWSAAPVNAFTLWPTAQVAITQGEDDLACFNKTDNSDRKFCKRCGGHVLTNHPRMKMVDVYAATIPGFAFDPTLHVNYGEKVLSIKDGLPKFHDFPSEFGGSGETLPE